jgi:phage terminase large subunit
MAATGDKTKKKYAWGELDHNGRPQYPVHKAQADCLRSKARYVFACAGTGGGKSAIIPIWLWHRIKENPKGRFLLVVPTYKMFEKVGLSRDLDHLLRAVGWADDKSYNKSKYIYRLKCGAEIFIVSADDPSKLEGGQWTAIAVDEAGKISKKAWENIADRSQRYLVVSTPDTNNWLYHEIYKACNVIVKPDTEFKSSDGKYYMRRWATIDNPAKANEDIELHKKRFSKGEFARRYLGEFATLDGLIYETFGDAIIRTDDQKPPLKTPSPVVRVGIGVDWGYSPDPLCILVGVECQDGCIYVVEEVYGCEIPNESIRNHLTRLKRHWSLNSDDLDIFEGGRFVGIFCDSSEPKTINYLKSQGIAARGKTVPLIETGISMVDQRMRCGFLKIYDTCENLIEESQHYVRIPDSEGDFDKPRDKDNHALDCLRYLITGMDHGRQLDFVRAAPPEEPEQAREEVLKRLSLISEDGREIEEREREEANREIAERLWQDAGDSPDSFLGTS